MTENVFFQRGDIIIDRHLARFGTTSYPIANIGSVSTKKISRAGQAFVGGVIAIVGIGLLANHNVGGGVLAILVGALLWWFAKSELALVLRTSSGDQQAFQNRDHSLVGQIKTAIEAAITSR